MLVCGLALAGPSGCGDAVDLEALSFACESDAECRPDKVCDPVAGVCVSAGEVETRDAGGDPVQTPSSVTCQEYCDFVQLSCSGDHRQYRSVQHCVDFCEGSVGWEAGFEEDQVGNTLACRMNHLQLAPQDPAAHCAEGGPTGGGLCGDWCEVYCDMADKSCTGDSAIFASRDECLSTCPAIATGGAAGDFTGDTLQCRLSYLQLARLYEGGQETFCPAAAPFGGACAPTPLEMEPDCENYCAIVEAACYPNDLIYASPRECLDMCSEWARLPAGVKGDTTENTIACRIAHTAESFVDYPELHCPVASFDGGNICGSWCDNYCHLVGEWCTGDHALFGSEAECQLACAQMSTSGMSGDLTSNTVQCRITHVIEAGIDTVGGPAAHCPAAAPGTDGPCSVEPPSCATYCERVMATCAEEGYAQYESVEDCVTFCEDEGELPAGLPGDASGNTIGCRMTFADEAVGGDQTACHAAGPTGNNVCGSWCDNYCHLAQAACEGDQRIYDNHSQCIAACPEIKRDGRAGDLDGDSVQCRLSYLLEAAESEAKAAEYCPYAAKSSAPGGCRE